MNVIVNGLMTSYLQWGTGRRVIVLVHGWADKATSFSGLAEALAVTYKVVAVDLPGFGGSQPPPHAWGLPDYAQFVRNFLVKVGEPRPYALVGHSNGGAIAIVGLAQGVLDAQKLVLIASAGVRTTAGQTLHRIVWKAIAKVGKAATLALPAAVRAKLRRNLYRAAGSDMLVAEQMQETFKRVVNQDVREQAAQLQLPVLCIYGMDDTDAPPQYGQLLAEHMAKSQFITIPGAGHFIHQEKAAEVAELIKGFLA